MGNEASQEGEQAGLPGSQPTAPGGGGGFQPTRVGTSLSGPRPQFSGPVPMGPVPGQSPGMSMIRPPISTTTTTTVPVASAPPQPPPTTQITAGPPDVDLSHLSAEEQAMIFRVMARAENLEKAPELTSREADIPVPKRTGQQYIRRACPMCHISDIPPNQNDCADCRLKVCQLCGSLMPSPTTKMPEWVCNTCAKRRQQQMKMEAAAAHQSAEQLSQEHSNNSAKYQSHQGHPQQYSHQSSKAVHQETRSAYSYHEGPDSMQRNQMMEEGGYERYRQDMDGAQMTKEGGRVISVVSNKPKATPVVSCPEPAVYSDDEEDNDILESDDSEYESEQKRKVSEMRADNNNELEKSEDALLCKQRENNRQLTDKSEQSIRNQSRDSDEIAAANLKNQSETCMSNGFWDVSGEKKGSLLTNDRTMSLENNNEDAHETSKSEEEEDNYGDSSTALQLECFEHNPGEVYTIIEEEEDDGLSPNDPTCLKWHRGAVPTYPDPVTMKPKRLGDPPTVVTNQNIMSTKSVTHHVKGSSGPNTVEQGTMDSGALHVSRSDVSSGVISGRISESVSPDFASSGAGMAISNMISSSQMHHTYSQAGSRKLPQQMPQPQQAPMIHSQQSSSNGAASSQSNMPKGSTTSPPTKSKVKSIELQNQKKTKSKPDPQDWSPTNDLSPILDVSPSLEAAEQEQMAKYQGQSQYEGMGMGVTQQQFHHQNAPMTTVPNLDGQVPSSAPSKSATGTISGMLADFSKALGLGGSSQRPSTMDERPVISIPQTTPVHKQQSQHSVQQQHLQQSQPLDQIQRTRQQQGQQQIQQHHVQQQAQIQQHHAQQQHPQQQHIPAQQQQHYQLQQQQPHFHPPQQQQQQQQHFQPPQQQQQQHFQPQQQQPQFPSQQQQQFQLQQQQQQQQQQLLQQQFHQQQMLQQLQQEQYQQLQMQGMHHPSHHELPMVSQSQLMSQAMSMKSGEFPKDQQIPYGYQGQQQWTQSMASENNMQEMGMQPGLHSGHHVGLQPQMGSSPKARPRTVITSAIGVTPVMGVPAGTLIRQSGSPQIGRREQLVAINKGPMSTEVAPSNLSTSSVSKPSPAPRISQQVKVDDTPTTVTAFSHAHVTAAVKAVAVMADREEGQSGEAAEASARTLESPSTPSRRLQGDDHSKRTIASGDTVAPSPPRPFSPLAAIGTYSFTPSSTPQTPQSQRGGDSDTQSEADSTKSTKVRRRLPPLPADQDIFNHRQNHSGSRLGYPLRHGTWEGGTRSRSSLGKYAYLDASRPYSSDSETSLKGIYYAEGLKATKSISATNLSRSASQYEPFMRYDSAGLSGASLPSVSRVLPRSALDRYDRQMYLSSQRLPLRKDVKEAIEERYRMLGYKDAKAAQFRRELVAAGVLPKGFDTSVSSFPRIMEQSSVKPFGSLQGGLPAHLTQMAMISKKEQRKRQLSDAQLYGLSRNRNTRNLEKKHLYQKPFKSFEYECIDDGYRNKGLLKKTLASDHATPRPSTSLGALTDSYISGRWAYDSANLRDTPIGMSRDHYQLPASYFSDASIGNRLLAQQYSGRRNSINRSLSQEAISWKNEAYKRHGLSYLSEDLLRAHQGAQGYQRSWKSRSWHPSPSVSEDEDDQFNREEKKQKIKAEIARRRKQIEENVILHKELLRLAQTRQISDAYGALTAANRGAFALKSGGGDGPNGYSDDSGYSWEIPSLQGSYHQPHRPLDQSRSMPSISSQDEFKESGSVLRSINEILQYDYGKPAYEGYDDMFEHSDLAPMSYSRQQSSQYESHDPFPGGYVGEDLYEPHDMMTHSAQKSGKTKTYYGTTSSMKRLSAEDKSIEMIASTFAPEYGYTHGVRNSYYNGYNGGAFIGRSPLDTPTDSTPAMPLLPDMPSRSRKLLEDLHYSYGSDTTSGTPRPILQHSQSEDYGSHIVYSNEEAEYLDNLSSGVNASGRNDYSTRNRSQSSRNLSNPQTVHESDERVQPRYPFPVKRIFLTRDHKDKSIGGNGFGLSLVGGKVIPGSNGMLGAFVSKIYPGGVVGTLREVKEGDQVLEWNGIDLTNLTNEEVQKCVAQSNGEIEILVRSLEPVKTERKTPGRNTSSNADNCNYTRDPYNPYFYNEETEDQPCLSPQKKFNSNNNYAEVVYQNEWGENNDNSMGRNGVNNKENASADVQMKSRVLPLNEQAKIAVRQPHGSASETERGRGRRMKGKSKRDKHGAEIQLQICYDIKAQILYVTTLQARNLFSTRASEDKVPDPFVTCQLLPGRSVENQRRTRYLNHNANPEWKQTMVYPNIPQEELKKRYLEVTVWNFDSSQQNEFLGEVLIDLSVPTTYNEEPRWYSLKEHQECQIRSLDTSRPASVVLPNRHDAPFSRPTTHGIHRRDNNVRNYNEDVQRNA